MNVTPSISDIYKILEEVTDPEIPVLTILDLGIVRDVQCNTSGTTVTITPTYSGCPAMDAIAADIKLTLISKGIQHVSINFTLDLAVS